MQISLTFTRPQPKNLLAESRNSGLSTFLVTLDEGKKQAVPNERITLIFPSPDTEFIDPVGTYKVRSQKRPVYPFQVEKTNTQSSWIVAYNQGGASFYMPHTSSAYYVNIDISAGVITKFDCYRGSRTVLPEPGLFSAYGTLQ